MALVVDGSATDRTPRHEFTFTTVFVAQQGVVGQRSASHSPDRRFRLRVVRPS